MVALSSEQDESPQFSYRRNGHTLRVLLPYDNTWNFPVPLEVREVVSSLISGATIPERTRTISELGVLVDHMRQVVILRSIIGVENGLGLHRRCHIEFSVMKTHLHRFLARSALGELV